MQFTRTVGANVSASPIVSTFSPALAHAYASSRTLAKIDPTVLTLMIEPPPSGDHARADERGEPERSLQVDRVRLVVQSSVIDARSS